MCSEDDIGEKLRTKLESMGLKVDMESGSINFRGQSDLTHQLLAHALR